MTQKPKISIIIPCLNEQKHISILLKSIKAQNFPCEIIVADAGSKDKTREIARKFNARIVRGGLPAEGRNIGAKAARADLFLFLDADVILPKDFLKFCYNEIKINNLDAATCYALPISDNLVDMLNYQTANLWMDIFKKIKPYAHGFCIFATKKIHRKIRGFDESLKFGEDSEYIIRANKIGNFDIIKKYINASVRRFEKEGRLYSALKYSYLNLYRLIIGEIKKDVGYNFGHYSK